MSKHTILPLLLLTALTSALPQGSQSSTDPSPEECSAPGTSITNTQSDAPHGLFQISHRDAPEGGAVDNSEYIYHPNAGLGTCAISIDTGINPTHNEYADRVLQLWDCIGAGSAGTAEDDFGCERVTEESDKYVNFDGNGHGTHTAGTMVGTKYGVAKKANLIGVRVLSAEGSGSTNDIAAAVKLATKLHNDLVTPTGPCPRGAVVNLSLGTGLLGTFLSNSAGKDVVNAAADAGLFCAIAAGNSDSYAGFASPANALKACTVGALDAENKKSCFSNYGDVVDVHAAGEGVLSAFKGANDATVSLNTPHVPHANFFGPVTNIGSSAPGRSVRYIHGSTPRRRSSSLPEIPLHR